MSDESIDLLCHRCGKTFSAFLHQMQEQNSKVVCPDCRENPDCEPPKSARGAAAQPFAKPN
jgi:hypothetical protein